MDKMRDKTRLAENYSQQQNIPPLLICNQNKTERVNENLLKTSVLLQGEIIECKDLDRNQNQTIFQRNLPTMPLPVNVDVRPISSSKCSDPRFLKERESLETYNQYQPNFKCDTQNFMPGKGTVHKFFDNIDVDSELKNINQIDTKCSEPLFKIDPRDNNTKLSCYSNTLVKDYKKCDDSHGYTWCDYQKYGNLEKFDLCDSQKFKCANPDSNLNIYDNLPPNGGRLISNGVLSNDMMNQIKLQQKKKQKEATTLLEQEKNRIRQIEADIKLLDQKRDLTLENNINRYRTNYAPIQKPPQVVEYKSEGATNVYAPIVRKQSVDPKHAYQLGKQKGMDIQVDFKIKERLNEMEKQLGKKNQGYDSLPYSGNMCSIQPITEPEIFPFQCREQTRNLYKFNKLVDNSKDCLFCEQLFNNQTKRKHISVGRVPEYIFQDQ